MQETTQKYNKQTQLGCSGPTPKVSTFTVMSRMPQNLLEKTFDSPNTHPTKRILTFPFPHSDSAFFISSHSTIPNNPSLLHLLLKQLQPVYEKLPILPYFCINRMMQQCLPSGLWVENRLIFFASIFKKHFFIRWI